MLSFTVSHDGVVHEKDFGPKTLDEFKNTERFNPDKSWTPFPEEDQQRRSLNEDPHLNEPDRKEASREGEKAHVVAGQARAASEASR